MQSDGGSTWPAVGRVSVDWTPTLAADLLTRRQRDIYRGPYTAAVVPRIADVTPRLPAETSTAAAEASLALTRFDSELGGEIAPFATLLLRSESASSSQIENLSSGAKQIALAELGSREKRNATEIVGNVAAMKAAVNLADRLDTKTILEMHRALMNEVDPASAGRWRNEPVWIGGSSHGPHTADYVAPPADEVPGLIDDTLSFARRPDIPPLIQAAIAHAQFETIHPFPDGNGRTGRALLQAMLRASGVTRNVTVPVSAGLLANTHDYFAALDSYRRGDPAPIVDAMSRAAVTAVVEGTRLVSDLDTIRRAWSTRLTARRGSSASRLLDVVLQRPVVDRSAIADALDITRDNVSRAVNPLVDAGILHEFTGFGRNRIWEAKEVTAALDDFAERSRCGR